MTINEMNKVNSILTKNELDSIPCKMPFDMTVEEWKVHISKSVGEHKRLRDAMTDRQLYEYSLRFNQRLIDEVIKDWDCAKMEHIIHIHPNLTFQFPADITPEEYRAYKIKKNAELAAYNADYHTTLPRKTKRHKSRATAYNMLLDKLLPGAIKYIVETYHYGVKDKAFILSEAKNFAQEEAYRFVYVYKHYDDYNFTAITDTEKENAV